MRTLSDVLRLPLGPLDEAALIANFQRTFDDSAVSIEAICNTVFLIYRLQKKPQQITQVYSGPPCLLALFKFKGYSVDQARSLGI